MLESIAIYDRYPYQERRGDHHVDDDARLTSWIGYLGILWWINLLMYVIINNRNQSVFCFGSSYAACRCE